MIEDLEFLRGEATKIQNILRKESGNNYKKYATLFQVYLTTKGNVQQLEAFQKQQAEEAKRKAEEEKILKEAEAEIKAEKKSKKADK